MNESDCIVIRGARQHNLKNIDISIPRHKLVVITGVSGSGKSSLAFDTIFAEAQRRYMEGLSPFIRRFMDKVERPKVEFIGGLSPAIAIDQKQISKNPRSTVGTVTELLDYFRLLYSRIGIRHCLECGSRIEVLTPTEIANRILPTLSPKSSLEILAPVILEPSESYITLFERARENGVSRARINGSIHELGAPIKLSKTEKYTVELVIDQLTMPSSHASVAAKEEFARTLTASLNTALQRGNGTVVIVSHQNGNMKFTSKLVCPNCGSPFPDLTSQHFSFNSPFGMCPDCHGMGTKLAVKPELLIQDTHLSILDGALSWFGNLRENKRSTWPVGPLGPIAEHYGVDLNTPWKDLPRKFRNVILFGSGDEKINFPSRSGQLNESLRPVKGLVPEIARLYRESIAESMRKKYAAYMTQELCSTCHGSRLNTAARSVTLHGKTIAEASAMPISDVMLWLKGLYSSLSGEHLAIADEILREVHNRLTFMINLGLHYLTLIRSAPTLSGGEGQRVRLSGQLGSGLVGVLYILDEPSIGLHPRDHNTLLHTLMKLREVGNSVVLVEHDAETMQTADWLIDLGPGAGIKGGEVIAFGPPEVVMSNPRSLTGQYLSGSLGVRSPNNERRTAKGQWLTIVGARLHNLKNVTARFPLGLVTCVTGVSGSGKSSLIMQTLEPALSRALNKAQTTPGPYERLEGLDFLDKAINITHDPIGDTPRSNPATYTKVFDEIRITFAKTPEATKRKYSSDRFSFNVKGGRCEVCRGYGQKRIEMHFLSDIYVTCSECKGARYNPDTLSITFRGKNIAEVLNMDVDEALEFFYDNPRIQGILQTLHNVGLGYIKLGQSAITLSGGEAQRIKLARELSRIATGRTIYILDEPTTGLHFVDIQRLLDVLHRLAKSGNSVIIIEHNLDVIKTADWIIDMGPEGGEHGGEILAEGPPEEIAALATSYTGQFLKKVLASPGLAPYKSAGKS